MRCTANNVPRAPIRTPVVGTLSIIYADEGATVDAGDTVGECESMKLFFPLVAPVAGTVHWRFNLGEIVGETDVIAEIIEP